MVACSEHDPEVVGQVKIGKRLKHVKENDLTAKEPKELIHYALMVKIAIMGGLSRGEILVM